MATRLRLADLSLIDEAFTIIDDVDRDRARSSSRRTTGSASASAGYRSVLIVRVKAKQQLLGLQFWSKRPRAFDASQVPVARRIADHVASASSHEQLAEAARQAAEARLRAERLEIRVKSLSDELAARIGHGCSVGPSAEWQAVLKAATQVAATDTTVLLAGESGTGKEVVARFIHRASAREAGPFVALNCAALPEQLLESELFGYERGAFTGAQQSKPGQIELAAGGVLFLDEVSEMSASAQAKFLRVLQEREFQRLGGTRMLKANVRVIAATNRDLKKAMERGDFREDLYYRLQVFDIKLPPLRERAGDILPLSEAFLQEIGRLFGRPPAGLTREAKEALLRYHWPGNVRELRNALERAAILCEGGLITAEHLSLDRQAAARGRGARRLRSDRPECRRARFDRPGVERVPRQQVDGGGAAGLVAHAALRPPAQASPVLRPLPFIGPSAACLFRPAATRAVSPALSCSHCATRRGAGSASRETSARGCKSSRAHRRPWTRSLLRARTRS